ncbi:hypothetical protein ASE75_07580 [Sphingomonas sp. Leaf17]|uniref:hypothetical protein n=1 Tax=Sphingomonas sp. Leaf17 TaxID=1735683 RepID=UPI0007019F7E|nr:hypothetical protein [Sphingomonas sp. Leaf17]KQM64923.1 hypothetical protein ASE75_07580 [Sphingomonas sp. Leaf17]
MTIEMLLLAGALIGFIIGLALRNSKFGCAALWIVPLAMIAYVYACQSAHPESLTSTSGLEFLFVPLWASLGAMGGYVIGTSLRYFLLAKRDGS